jgi:hypothetical protein
VGSLLFHFFDGGYVERQREKIDVRVMLGHRPNLKNFYGFCFGVIGLCLKGCFGTEVSRFWKKNFAVKMAVFMNSDVEKVVFMNSDVRMVSLSFTSCGVAKVF